MVLRQSLYPTYFLKPQLKAWLPHLMKKSGYGALGGWNLSRYTCTWMHIGTGRAVNSIGKAYCCSPSALWYTCTVTRKRQLKRDAVCKCRNVPKQRQLPVLSFPKENDPERTAPGIACLPLGKEGSTKQHLRYIDG